VGLYFHHPRGWEKPPGEKGGISGEDREVKKNQIKSGVLPAGNVPAVFVEFRNRKKKRLRAKEKVFWWKRKEKSLRRKRSNGLLVASSSKKEWRKTSQKEAQKKKKKPEGTKKIIS